MVGRLAELTALVDATRRTIQGRGAVAVVTGEVGIGKTHLLESLDVAVSSLGVALYAASAHELDQRRLFGPLLDALAVGEDADDPRRANVVARLDPGRNNRDPAATEFWVGEGLFALLDELCASDPVVLVIDDLQWADPATVSLVGRLARVVSQWRLLIVLAVRPPPRRDGVSRLVASLHAAGGLCLTLTPLTDDEVSELATQDLGVPPGGSLQRLLRTTGGSPLFVRELLAALRGAGALHIDIDRTEAVDETLAPSLSAVVNRRLSQLQPDTIDLLRVAAVLGDPFGVVQLGLVTGERASSLGATLRPALAAGVLRTDGSRLQFVHEVIRATLYDDIPLALRIGLHRDIAVALEAAGAPALEVAEHHLRSATPGDRDAVDALRRAASASCRQSPAAAAELLEKAAELLPATAPEHALLAQERARYLGWAGRAVDAETICRAQLSVPNDTGAERSLRRTLVAALLTQSRMAEALDEARRLAAAAPPRTTESTRATAALSYALLTTGNVDEAEATAEESIRHPEAEDPGASYTAHVTLAVACRVRAKGAEGLRHLDLAEAVARRSTRPLGDQNPVGLWRALLLLDLDRLDEALRTAHRGRAAAEEAGVSSALANYQFATASTLHARGEVDDAVAEYHAGIELAEELGTGWRLSGYGALASIAVRSDDLRTAADLVAEGEAHLQRTGAQPQLPLFLRARSELLEASGRPADALACVADDWRSQLRAGVIGSVPFFGPDVVRLAVAASDHELAAAMTDAAEQAAHRLGTSTAAAAALRCTGAILGNCEALVAATELLADNPRPLARAAAHDDAGRALAAAGRVDDARRHLLAAIDAYERLGAIRDVARLDAAARAAGIRRGQRGTRRRPTHGWDSLTTTEQRVADLVAAGLSNPRIAERMFLSRRTVQTHVSHVLGKVGMQSRVELAAAMARRTDRNLR